MNEEIEKSLKKMQKQNDEFVDRYFDKFIDIED